MAVHAKDFEDDRRLQDGGYDGGYEGGYEAPPTAAPPTAAPPTAAPPTAPPTETFEMSLEFADISSFNETQFLLEVQSATQSDVAISSIEYTVSTSVSFSVEVSEAEAKDVIAEIMGVVPSQVHVTITTGGRLLSFAVVGDQARRLASDVDASIIVTDFALAQSVQSTAENTNSTQEALVEALSSSYGKVATVSLGAVMSEVKVITAIAGASVSEISGGILSTIEAAVQEMGGDVSAVASTLPIAPTAPPTAPPTASPTTPPTAAPLSPDEQDSACKMGATALALIAVAVALQEFA